MPAGLWWSSAAPTLTCFCRAGTQNVRPALPLAHRRSGQLTATKAPTTRVAPSRCLLHTSLQILREASTVLAAIQPAIEPGCELRTFECVCGHSVSLKVRSLRPEL